MSAAAAAVTFSNLHQNIGIRINIQNNIFGRNIFLKKVISSHAAWFQRNELTIYRPRVRSVAQVSNSRFSTPVRIIE